MNASKLFILVLLCSTFTFAQVGVNIPANTAVNSSAAFEIQSGSSPKGMLVPRMTTADRLSIATPADGLIVYDTDLKSFYYYKSAITGPPAIPATWNRLNSEASGRLNFKRIKSTDVLATVLAEEKAAGGGTKYLLNTNTYYEINGTINVDLPIALNNAYVVGLDANEDKLVKSSGNLFDDTKGGTIKNVTITVTGGGNAFALVGTAAENLIIRDCIIAGCSNVGSISGYGLVFCSVIQYAGNTTGIVYNNISQLLLSNLGWFGTNSGTFEKLTGTFKLVQKQGGFSEVNGTAVGFDVSNNPTISGDAVLESVVFTGVFTGSGAYVKGYTAGSYTGYNFNNKWNVRSAGIPVETDAVAVGDVSFDLGIGFGNPTTLTTGTGVKIQGTTTSNNFFRISNGTSDNKLVYLGNKKRYFTVNSSLSFVGTNTSDTQYIFYIKKNGTIDINQSKTYAYTTNTIDIRSTPIQCVIEMNPGDFIEVFANRFNGTSNMLTVSLNLFMR